MKRVLSLLLVFLLMCASAPAEETTLTYFFFSFGGYLPPQSYEVTVEDHGYRLERDDGASCRMDQAAMEGLLAVIDSDRLSAWDGFDESAQDVLDGEGFSFEAAFSDGTSIRAHGDNLFPEGYHDAKKEIVRLLDQALDGDFAGTYAYLGEGFGGDFTITLEADGAYTFYEGALSSYMGGGRWYAERRYIYLIEENGLELQFYFSGEGDTLTYEGRYSDEFPHVKVPDGGKFERVKKTADRTGEEIADFYYTYSTSTYPPFFQRYRFYREDGKYFFYHETREGGGWPQTEADITAAGTVELTEDAWAVFLRCLEGGTIKPPTENDVDGDDGPWLYVYRGRGQEEYEFPSYGARLAFEKYCEELRGSTKMKISVTDGEHTILYRLNDSPPAKSLYGMLPLELAVENYGYNEKIFYPEERLETADGVEGGGEAGGLALFSPWGNVVMYYDSFSAYPGLYILGEAIEGVDQVKDLTGMIHIDAVK